MPPKANEVEETPITTKMLLVWGGVVTTFLSGVISVVWFAASIKADVARLGADHQAAVAEWRMRGELRDREIDKLKNRADGTDKALADLARKLDVAVALLERIDKKVGSP